MILHHWVRLTKLDKGQIILSDSDTMVCVKCKTEFSVSKIDGEKTFYLTNGEISKEEPACNPVKNIYDAN
jgi:hypothetical protein